MPKRCAVCGYDSHVELCHIRRISDFPLSATFAEVNAEANLVYLCPNHHWELDAGKIRGLSVAANTSAFQADITG
jgi:predicted restriction endonuclease